MLKKAYIATLGCQMNEHDSERMAGILSAIGYQITEELYQADLALVNTCSIRQKAEEKAYSLLGRIADYKKQRPDLVMVVTGCLAQQEGERFFRRFPSLNLVVGPRCIYRLADLLQETDHRVNHRIACTDLNVECDCSPHIQLGQNKVKAYVSIMTGCNNFCSYCIVPYVRGREFSRENGHILKEAKGLVEQGVREITLIGQNVNSYGLSLGDEMNFSDLVKQVDGVKGLERLRFTTSHPKDISDELIACFESVKSLCEHIHLPVQSGSDRILGQMNRRYTRDEYLDRVAKLKKTCSSIAITTDIIVGFPGETDSDHEATLDLMKEVGFAGSFAFKYSDRPPARSVLFKNKVTEKVKQERLENVLELQKELTCSRNESMIGKTVDVLVEGRSKNSRQEWMGRTRTNEVVNFSGEQDLLGALLKVKLEKACLHSLRGSLV